MGGLRVGRALDAEQGVWIHQDEKRVTTYALGEDECGSRENSREAGKQEGTFGDHWFRVKLVKIYSHALLYWYLNSPFKSRLKCLFP